MPSAIALRSSVAVGSLLCVAVIAAGTLGAVHPASAQSYWREMEPGYESYQHRQIIQPSRQRQQRAHRGSAKKEVVKDTAVHPQMPLIINVSIARQKVTVYDANGVFAQAPVSTGMAGHPTPMGVFSVIQKDRYHHSNIYSGAPMPFMQRITWGGVALHAGVLPGYPASHGCIRMPESFAIKMWGWTKLGARVIVTPGELSPSSFSHPLLPVVKVVPQPAVAEQPDTNEAAGAKADRGSADPKPVEASLDLRSTVGHGDAAPGRDQTHTADGKPADAAKVDTANVGNASQIEPSTDGVGKDSKSADAGDIAKSDSAEAKPAATANVLEAVKLETAKADVPAAAPSLDAAKSNTTTTADKSAEPLKAATAAGAPAPAADAKDQTRLVEPPKPAVKRREGQLAVFISRKDSKLYARQNFAPWFEVPVTIAPSDRPLGTHVFTAEVDKTDSNALRWSVITVPLSARAAMREADGPRASRRHRGKNAPAAEAKPAPVPDSPAEALDRITIPPEVMARISDALATGASIIVSDQGINQGETGEYTDFIIRTW